MPSGILAVGAGAGVGWGGDRVLECISSGEVRIRGDYGTGSQWPHLYKTRQQRGLFFGFQITVLGIKQVLCQEQGAETTGETSVFRVCSGRREPHGVGRVTSSSCRETPGGHTPLCCPHVISALPAPRAADSGVTGTA